jgi:hypothetical protein
VETLTPPFPAGEGCQGAGYLALRDPWFLSVEGPEEDLHGLRFVQRNRWRRGRRDPMLKLPKQVLTMVRTARWFSPGKSLHGVSQGPMEPL